MDGRVARQARRRPDAGVAGEPLEDCCWIPIRSLEALRSGGTRIWMTLKAVVEVLAELAGLDFGAEVPLRRAQQTNRPALR
jgi:hypothetical protein